MLEKAIIILLVFPLVWLSSSGLTAMAISPFARWAAPFPTAEKFGVPALVVTVGFLAALFLCRNAWPKPSAATAMAQDL